MRIVRLKQALEWVERRQWDVCVVGAGAAGIYLSCKLAQLGLETLLVEAGDESEFELARSFFPVEFEATRYNAALNGRRFGIGGTTSIWGGQLFPYVSFEERNRVEIYSDSWRSITSIVSKRLDDVLHTLGQSKGIFFYENQEKTPIENNSLCAEGLTAARSLWLPFRKRNFSRLLYAAHSDRLTVITQAIACGWPEVLAQHEAHAEFLEVSSYDGCRSKILAKHYVLAAGSLETARILLEWNEQFQGRILPRKAALGRYLSDHLSYPIALVHPADRKTAIRLFAPIFSGEGGMSTLRILGVSGKFKKFPRFFAHCIFDRSDDSFSIARDFLLSLQGRRLPSSTSPEILLALPGLMRMAWDRVVLKRLFVPRSAEAKMVIDMEQIPDIANGIRLGSDRDKVGRKVMVVNWRISEADQFAAGALKDLFLDAWSHAGVVEDLPKLESLPSTPNERNLYDVYHPVGVTMLGDHSEAVVTRHLRVHGVSNIWVLCTGLFPSAGAANPTLSMLCLGEELAFHLYHDVIGSASSERC